MDMDELQNSILEKMYLEYRNGNIGLQRKDFKDIEPNDQKLDSAFKNLKSKGYIEIKSRVHTAIGIFYIVTLSKIGIAFIENSKHFKNKFQDFDPVIHDDDIIFGMGSEHVITILPFKRVYDEINNKNPENRIEIVKNVRMIEKELSNEIINKSNVKTSLNYLKNNASWILPGVFGSIIAMFEK
ncbi:hypothetical protein [Methanococcus maripaludis]|uniref:Uncharacterized protein n=1 Tax=Methanococcus maripaludis TaxID=39152 RepID=A0A8T4H2P6_METMI|nr:hypothetical protein [Methanococcus maripaludis]MBM7409061.1 hypothetical protein [Methanococcus maripaludis]MBP2218753.1 hypothetical protein [Methanococcus maripaludis]